MSEKKKPIVGKTKVRIGDDVRNKVNPVIKGRPSPVPSFELKPKVIKTKDSE